MEKTIKMEKTSEIVLLCNNKENRMEMLKDVFEFLNTNKIGKLTNSHYCCPTNIGIPEHINIKGKEIFNMFQQKSRIEGSSTICYCKSLIL